MKKEPILYHLDYSSSKEAPGTAGWGLNLLPVLASWESKGIALKNDGSSFPKKIGFFVTHNKGIHLVL